MELTRRSFVAGTAAVGVAAALGGTAIARPLSPRLPKAACRTACGSAAPWATATT